MNSTRKSQGNRDFTRAVKKVIDEISKTEPKHKILNFSKGGLKTLLSGTSAMNPQYLKINYFITTRMQKISSIHQFILEMQPVFESSDLNSHLHFSFLRWVTVCKNHFSIFHSILEIQPFLESRDQRAHVIFE